MIKTVKSCRYIILVVVSTILVALTLCTAHISHTRSSNGLDRRNLREYNSQVIKDNVNKNENTNTMMMMKRRADTYRVAGSRLPDCLHACGSCSPCHLVMVHLGCTNSLAEPETCPMAYKCFCINKSYPVP